MGRQRFIFVFILLAFVSLTAPSTGAQDTARAAPSNDSFAGAKPIIIGKEYTVSNIPEATVEGGQPLANCGIASTLYNSVWYTFTLPYNATIFFSTAGSFFYYSSATSYDTRFAIYTGASLGALTQSACADDVPTQYAEMTFAAQSNTTYYLLVGTNLNETMLPGSTLILKSRMIVHSFDLPNYGFETAFAGNDWKVTNASGDDRQCSNGSFPAYIGACAFGFQGGSGENSRLKLSKPLPSYFLPRKGAILTLYFYYRVMGAPLGNAKIKFKVSYSDGTPTSSAIVNLTGTSPMGIYQYVSRNIMLASKAVAKVQHQVDFKSATGVLMLDEAKAYYYAAPIIRSAGPLPLPLAAK